MAGAPQALNANHSLEGFDCGKPALNDWLIRHARQAQASGSAKSYVVIAGDHVAGYFSLTLGQIDALEASERVRKGMGNFPIPQSSLRGLQCPCKINARASVLACCRMRLRARRRLPNRRAYGPC